MAYTQGVARDAITNLGLGQLPIPIASAVPELENAVSSIFGGDKAAAQRTADLQSAYLRGDAQYITTWINDIPPHPNQSVALAKTLLAKLQQGPSAQLKPSVGTMAIGGSMGTALGSPVVLLMLGAGVLLMLSRR